MEDVRGKPEQRKRGSYRPLSATPCPVLLALSGRPRGWRKHLCTQNYGDRTGRSPENPLSPQCPGFLTKEGGAGCVRSSFPSGMPRTGPAEDGGEAEGPAAPPLELRNHRNRCSASERSSRSMERSSRSVASDAGKRLAVAL